MSDDNNVTPINGDAKPSPKVKIRAVMNAAVQNQDSPDVIAAKTIQAMAVEPFTESEREVLFKELKGLTGIAGAVLKADFEAERKVHPGMITAALRQSQIAMGIDPDGGKVNAERLRDIIINSMGGPECFLYSQDCFYVWRDRGLWETIKKAEIELIIMNTADQYPDIATSANLVSNNILGMLKIAVYKDENIWTRSLDGIIVNVLNGELNLVTGGPVRVGKWELMPADPKHYFRSQVPVTWDESLMKMPPKDRHPHWSEFIADSMKLISGEDTIKSQRQFHMMLGYTLADTPPFIKKSPFLYGPTNSGKSVALDVLQWTLGMENYASLELSDLGEKFAIGDLRGTLANISGEIGKSEINSKRFKMLSGGDVIRSDVKNKDAIRFVYQGIFWNGGNALPGHGDKSGATSGRFIIINFPTTHTAPGFPGPDMDIALRDKLQGEVNAIAHTALQVFGEEYIKDNCLGLAAWQSDEAEAERSQWEHEMNPTLEWLHECIERDQEQWTDRPTLHTGDFYHHYKHWCQDNGHRYTSKNKFIKEVRKALSLSENVAQRIAGKSDKCFNLVTGSIAGHKARIYPTLIDSREGETAADKGYQF